MTAKVRQAFIDCNTEVDFIPPGYTSKLQMHDVGVSRPFKVSMRRQFKSWICTNTGVESTRQVVAQWIENAWGRITNNTTTNSWVKSKDMGNSTLPISPVDDCCVDDLLQAPINTSGNDSQ
jgi:DDE superfamily endonuclease